MFKNEKKMEKLISRAFQNAHTKRTQKNNHTIIFSLYKNNNIIHPLNVDYYYYDENVAIVKKIQQQINRQKYVKLWKYWCPMYTRVVIKTVKINERDHNF